MLYFILSAAILIIISYMLGSLVLTKINNNKIYFATPIGFFVLLFILQAFLYISKVFSLSNGFMHYSTFIVFALIIFIFILSYKRFKTYLDNLLKYKYIIVLALIFTIALLILFAQVDITLKTSDAIFYSNFVDGMIESNIIAPKYSNQYDYQVYYNLIASLKFLTSKLSYFGIYTDALTFTFMSWVFTIVHYFIFSLSIFNMFALISKKYKSKCKFMSLAILVTIMTSLNTWMIITPYFGNSVRRLAVAYLLYFIYDYFHERSKAKLIVMLMLFQTIISLSSSGLFLSGMMLYAFLVFSIFKKRHGFVAELSILALLPFIYAVIFIPKLAFPVILLYLFIIIIKIFKKIDLIENLLCKYCKVIVFIVPIVFAITPYIPFFNNLYETISTTFWGRPSYDWVPDLLRFTGYGATMWTILFNAIFWIIMGFVVIKKAKNIEFIPFFLFLVVFTFFNPFVYNFVYMFLTNVVFFRITDLFYNPFILMYIFVAFGAYFNTKIGTIMIIVINIILCTCQISIFRFNVQFNNVNDYNYIYHTSNKDIDLFSQLDNYLIENDYKDSYVFASQVYGTGMYSRMNISNAYNWQTQYLKDLSETNFTTVFFRREPGSDDYEVKYDEACKLAYDENIEYTIIDAQYNWKLEQGLWPCIEKVIEFDNYRVFKMRYDLWEWNIKQGYVADTRGKK